MSNFDLIVIGSGPGGYVAAIRASQLGMRTAVVERAELGGVCLNWGCIPTKALLRSAHLYQEAIHAGEFGVRIAGEITPDFERIVARSRDVAATMSKGVQFLFKKNGIETVAGQGKLLGNGKVEVTASDGTVSIIEAEHIILATGSRAKELPNLPIDGKKVIGYRQAITLEKQPASMVIVGSGAIGTELAGFYHAVGTKVTLVEFLPNIVPLEDEDVSKALERTFRKIKLAVMTNSSVEKVDTFGDLCRVSVKTPKGEEILESEVVLSAVGVAANIEDIGLEALGIATEKGKIKVDAHYRTNVKGVYAIGDIVPGPALAHVASAEAICCVEAIAGLDPEPIDYTNIPSCIYTSPEIASVGLTEKEAIEKGYEVRVGKFPYTASGKATAAGERDGFVKLVFDKTADTLIGAHLIGANVTEMVMEPVIIKKLGGTAKQIIKTIHPHPTMSEAVMEAAAAAHEEVIHL